MDGIIHIKLFIVDQVLQSLVNLIVETGLKQHKIIQDIFIKKGVYTQSNKDDRHRQIQPDDKPITSVNSVRINSNDNYRQQKTQVVNLAVSIISLF